MLEQGDTSEQPGLVVWTSTKRWATETGNFLRNKGYKVRHRTQLRQMSAGSCENMSDADIKKLYPEELAKYQLDPYHHRYPRGESYHDLAVRLEPIILELERASDDILIVAHESVLKVLYGYLMACHSADIPFLSLPRNEILKVCTEQTEPFQTDRQTCGLYKCADMISRSHQKAIETRPKGSIFPTSLPKSSRHLLKVGACRSSPAKRCLRRLFRCANRRRLIDRDVTNLIIFSLPSLLFHVMYSGRCIRRRRIPFRSKYQDTKKKKNRYKYLCSFSFLFNTKSINRHEA